ncbi:hypothetical protein M5K25_017681 [Dendrobium thyrsiflorum]|uniref:Uncharacterized protein n=1 Tax=Dendrobium thyrsiflorum TaxID=117978 RepID=A0ABD0UV34_DENTH
MAEELAFGWSDRTPAYACLAFGCRCSYKRTYRQNSLYRCVIIELPIDISPNVAKCSSNVKYWRGTYE